MTNLAGIVQAQAARAEQRERPALRQGSQTLTYADLARGSGRAAALLREAGVRARRPGRAHDAERARLPARSSTAPWPPAAVVVPMNPLLKSREVAHYLGDSGAR